MGEDEWRERFDALFLDRYRPVLRFIERQVGDDAAAQDIAAEVFATAWRKAPRVDPFPRAWLFAAARNLVGNHFRKTKRRRNAEKHLIVDVYDGESEADGDERRLLWAAMASLSLRQREVILLTYWEGLSAAEVGAVLGMTVSAVWTTLSRGRDAIRAAMLRANAFGEEVAR